MSKIVSMVLAVCVALSSWFFSIFGGDFEHEKKIDNNYPCVFVEGFLVGLGSTSGISDILPYWGAGSCDALKELNEMGYDCLETSIGPISSNWDRACELYAEIMGGRVDYGEAHAKAHNHKRYGRTYEKPLVENWGKTDENGDIIKINLIGHSYGGITVRLLLSLLADGDSAERAMTLDGSISPLFIGGKSEFVNSITTISAPNNGTTAVYAADEMGVLKFAEYLTYYMAGITGRSDLSQAFDFQLDQFGITPKKGEKTDEFLVRAVSDMMKNYNNDSAYYDLSPDGAKQLNDRSEIQSNVYYYTAPFSSTVEDENGYQVPTKDTFVILRVFGAVIGRYDKNHVSDLKIDRSWLENDGLVNTISEKNPFDEPYVDYNYGDSVSPGVWNVFPVVKKDHGYAIGLKSTKTDTLEYYTNLLDLINSNG